MTNNYILELKNVEKEYLHPSGHKIQAIENINLKFRENSLTIIQGPSGSGKTTLLKIIGMIEIPSQGSVLFKRKEIANISPKERSSLIRNEIGFILKHNNLLSYLNALENVMLPMINSNCDKIREMLIKNGFNDFNKYPDELSPLDQQKVALVRSLINSPSIILADEVTGVLNQADTEEFMNLLTSLKKEFTIIMVTDNPDLSRYADKYLKIENNILIH